MKKRAVALSLALLMLCAALPVVSAVGVSASPTASRVLVDGAEKAFGAYTIGGNNYFKLRDLAFVLSGTSKQFEVEWDGAKSAINLTTGKAYTTVGGEMTGKGAGNKDATPNTSKIYLNGTEAPLTAYTIEGNNYFKLRDLASVIDFGVGYDGGKNLIAVTSANGYYTQKYDLGIGRWLAEFVNGTFSYPAGTFMEDIFFDDLTFATGNYYGYNIIDGRGAVLESLPYQKIDQLSNGTFRAIYDIARDTTPYDIYKLDSPMYEKSGRTVVTNSYLSGKVVYLDKTTCKPLGTTVYTSGYDFTGPTAIAFDSAGCALVTATGAEAARIDGSFSVTSDQKYCIAEWFNLQDTYVATYITDLNGREVFREAGYNSADYLNSGCVVRRDESNDTYGVYDLDAKKYLSDRRFFGVSTFDANGLLRFTVAQEAASDEYDFWRPVTTYGLMNRQGTILIDSGIFAYIGRFKDGRAVAMHGGVSGNDAGYGGPGEFTVLLYPGITPPTYDPDGWNDRPSSWSENWADMPTGGTWEWIDQNGNKLGVPTLEELRAEVLASGLFYYTPKEI